MQVLGTVPAGTVIEKAEFDDVGYILHLKLPNGMRHGVVASDITEAWVGMMEWIGHPPEDKR